MSNNPTRRIPPTTLQADLDTFMALKGVTNYAPTNAAYTIAAIESAKKSMEERQAVEIKAAGALAAARDDATDGEWEFHNAVTGAKTQVEAQFGPNSDEIQALGLKKKSEYARPTRRAPVKPGTGE